MAEERVRYPKGLEMTIEYDFGSELKSLRTRYGMTQKEFSGRFGIPITTLSHWEQGHAAPPEYVKMMIRNAVFDANAMDPHPTIERSWDRPDSIDSPRNRTAMVKWYQFSVFYARELALWDENPVKDKTGRRLHEWIYDNRKFYVNKTAMELSDKELLNGLRISGAVRGYTSFDSSLMQKVIDEYDIASVYDPCAGWGERMLCAADNSVTYWGIDINEALRDGYSQMMSDLDLSDCHFLVDDSSVSDDVLQGYHFDALITCPPYGAIEQYSKYGAESLSEIEFLKWWRREVGFAFTASIKVFAFQINNVWRDKMDSIVRSFGYELDDEFTFSSNKSSHFTRSKGGMNRKSTSESMLVYKLNE